MGGKESGNRWNESRDRNRAGAEGLGTLGWDTGHWNNGSGDSRVGHKAQGWDMVHKDLTWNVKHQDVGHETLEWDWGHQDGTWGWDMGHWDGT